MVLSLVFVALVGVVVILAKRPLAELQANLAGGRVLPGCVVAQGAALILLALLLFWLYRSGAFA
jgi:hypothetical protein